MIQTINARLLHFEHSLFSVDVMGGIDFNHLERLVCTLRIQYEEYPPYRSTLDLYNERQSEKLVRSICDKFHLSLVDVSQVIMEFTNELETYRLNGQDYSTVEPFELNESDKQKALEALQNPDILKSILTQLNKIGLLGEDKNTSILWLALCSHKYHRPFSVLCLSKKDSSKSYLLQTFSECLPLSSFTYHSQISPNALYYFDSHQLKNKVLFVEDLEWTEAMLNPLSILQTQGRLLKTRATKNKEGMIHSTTFEVRGKLCLG